MPVWDATILHNDSCKESDVRIAYKHDPRSVQLQIKMDQLQVASGIRSEDIRTECYTCIRRWESKMSLAKIQATGTEEQNIRTSDIEQSRNRACLEKKILLDFIRCSV